ncbi:MULTISPECIES: hypothetical protein [Burkholderia]|uniref:hypothetical protein n=2 Tax=Burkholderia TaxID=32008 RepID=UPI0018D21C63|nr:MULTISPECIES: hypothetical protein [Burkholderia]
MAEILSPCRCNSRIVITSSSSTTDTPTTDLKGNMVGDRQDGAATAAPSDKKLGKITSTKVGSIYPTLTLHASASRFYETLASIFFGRPHLSIKDINGHDASCFRRPHSR